MDSLRSRQVATRSVRSGAAPKTSTSPAPAASSEPAARARARSNRKPIRRRSGSSSPTSPPSRFCKAHAVTYGRISYRAVWLKTHYPGALPRHPSSASQHRLLPRAGVRRGSAAHGRAAILPSGRESRVKRDVRTSRVALRRHALQGLRIGLRTGEAASHENTARANLLASARKGRPVPVAAGVYSSALATEHRRSPKHLIRIRFAGRRLIARDPSCSGVLHLLARSRAQKRQGAFQGRAQARRRIMLAVLSERSPADRLADAAALRARADTGGWSTARARATLGRPSSVPVRALHSCSPMRRRRCWLWCSRRELLRQQDFQSLPDRAATSSSAHRPELVLLGTRMNLLPLRLFGATKSHPLHTFAPSWTTGPTHGRFHSSARVERAEADVRARSTPWSCCRPRALPNGGRRDPARLGRSCHASRTPTHAGAACLSTMGPILSADLSRSRWVLAPCM